MRRNALLYGWHKAGAYFLSKAPPDATIRRSIEFETAADAAAYATRQRREILWIPALPKDRDARQSQFQDAQNPKSAAWLERR